MAGTCITCLSTQNLVDMKEKEWTVFDMLLHPVSKQYSSIRINLLVKICVNCQRSMHYVDQFRTAALRNFLYLMNLWNVGTTSTNATNNEPLNTQPVDRNPQPLWHTLSPTPLARLQNMTVVPKYSAAQIAAHSAAQSAAHSAGHSAAHSAAVNTNKNNSEENESSVEKRIEIETVLVKMEPQENFTEETNIADNVLVKQEPSSAVHENETSITEKPRDYSENTQRAEPPKVTLNIPKIQINSQKSPSVSKEKIKHSCKKCDKTYDLLKDLNFHEKRVHIGTPAECVQCGKTCRNEYCLRRHMINTHSEKTYCELCNKYFAFTSYKKHLKHSPKHNNPDTLKATRVSCEICASTLRDKHELKQHMRTHTEAKYCQPCDKWFPPRSYNNHIKQSLKHISRDDYKFTCDDCGEKFLTKTATRDHIMFVHLNINPFKCPLCPMEFKNHTTRSRHRRLVHENKQPEKKYVCIECGKSWHTAALLRDHMSAHTGKKSHKGHTTALFLRNRSKHEDQGASGYLSTDCPTEGECEKMETQNFNE
ncbi:hypothetical protein NE865_10379 [Phthorimaea operculella]|nr:hypothetical protein NE865_10379 [Phthorimaea operculella]